MGGRNDEGSFQPGADFCTPAPASFPLPQGLPGEQEKVGRDLRASRKADNSKGGGELPEKGGRITQEGVEGDEREAGGGGGNGHRAPILHLLLCEQSQG